MKMQNMFKFVVLVLSITISLFSEGPHILLHFDINKTLIASDGANNKSTIAVLNELLAEKYTFEWDETLKNPISFDAYVRQVLVPGSHDDLELRIQRREYLDHFIEFLRECNHPLYEEVLMNFNAAIFALNMSQGRVFPSFYRLIDELDRQGISHSIILRSFGKELFAVGNEIEKFCKKSFIHRSKFQKEIFYLTEDHWIEDLDEVYSLMRHSGHMAIQDDWNHWSTHGLIGRYGKPFYIDPEDSETISFFFDDHIRLDDPATAINIIAPINIKTKELVPIQELVESGQVVRVDTLKAILDDDYYLNIVMRKLQDR